MKRMLRRPAVEAATGLSRSTLYRKIGQGEFPKPIRLSERVVGWPEDVIAEWLASRREAA